MGAESDVARILHHMREQIAEHRVFERVEIDVARPHIERPLDVALGVGVEHVLHQFGRELIHVLDADDRARDPGFDADLDRTLGDVLGQIPVRPVKASYCNPTVHSTEPAVVNCSPVVSSSRQLV